MKLEASQTKTIQCGGSIITVSASTSVEIGEGEFDTVGEPSEVMDAMLLNLDDHIGRAFGADPSPQKFSGLTPSSDPANQQ